MLDQSRMSLRGDLTEILDSFRQCWMLRWRLAPETVLSGTSLRRRGDQMRRQQFITLLARLKSGWPQGVRMRHIDWVHLIVTFSAMA